MPWRRWFSDNGPPWTRATETFLNPPPIDLWGITASVVPLLGGHRNRAFRTLGLDNDLVFKTTRRDAAAIEWLVPMFGLAEQSGLIVPWPIKSRMGRYIECGWTCELFIHGAPFRGEDMSGIASHIHSFHESTWNFRQRPGFLSARELLDHDIGGDINLSEMPSDIIALCRKAWSRIEAYPMCVVHGDLNASNLLRTKDGRVAILDWDESRVDASLFDIRQLTLSDPDEVAEAATMAWEVACSWNIEPVHALRVAEKLIQKTGTK